MYFLSLHFLLFLIVLFLLVQAGGARLSVRNNLLLALLGGLGMLAYFKYANFFIETCAALLRGLGLQANFPLLQLMLPIGISFFTFQSLSYTLDVYRRQQAPCPSLRDFAVFVAFFPTVLSGPIIRARQLLPQIERVEPIAPERFESGLVLRVRGFVKKVMFADVLGAHLVDPAAYTWWFLLLAVYAYSFQLYMDLGGYTDIARGTARLLGFELPISFNRPYLADSVSNFWQRWHITMSGFFRDYLFFSLGGSKTGNVYVNLLLTFFAIGMWHGGVVTIERWARRRRKRRGLPPLPVHGWAWGLRIFVVFQIVALSRILFRAPDLAAAQNYAAALLAGSGRAAPLAAMGVAALLLAVVLHYIPARHTERLLETIRLRPPVQQACGLVLLIYALLALAMEGSGFIYFRF